MQFVWTTTPKCQKFSQRFIGRNVHRCRRLGPLVAAHGEHIINILVEAVYILSQNLLTLFSYTV